MSLIKIYERFFMKSGSKHFKLQHWHVIAIMLIIYDIIAMGASYAFALFIRFDLKYSAVPKEYFNAYIRFMPIYLVLGILIFGFFRLYRSIWRFASYRELVNVTEACFITTILHAVGITILFHRMPLSYYLVGALLQYCLVLGIRFGYRFINLMRGRRSNDAKLTNVLIIGAGSTGKQLLREIKMLPKFNERVVGFIDDNANKFGRYIDDVKVLGNRDDILRICNDYNVKKIYMALPSATAAEKRDIFNICAETECEIKSLPNIYEIASTGVNYNALRNVSTEDLLGRDQIKVDMNEIYDMINGKTVLITGGGGSIGSEIAFQVAKHNPKLLIIFDIYENNAYAIQNKIRREIPGCNLETLIGSVRDSRRVNDIFKKYRPDIVYHAAAHKHVPLMEDSPCEAIKNNVIGTYKVAYAAMMYGAQKFVLISTDKAVNPTNIMGASKRLCELVIQSFDKMIKEHQECALPVLHVHEEDGTMYPIAKGTQRYDENNNPVFTFPGQDNKGHRKAQTEFMAVRFGNVLGSNGSVVPIFKEQIRNGGPVTVTHPDIIRYFMTIPEAASLVLQAGAYAKGGEIFVLDMGEPVKIVDLAKNLIKLSGLKPDVDIKIVYTGLRPGEKLFEEKLMKEEGMKKTPNNLIHIGHPVEFGVEEFLKGLDDLMKVSYENCDAVKLMVERMVNTYYPTETISEELVAEYDERIERIVGHRFAPKVWEE